MSHSILYKSINVHTSKTIQICLIDKLSIYLILDYYFLFSFELSFVQINLLIKINYLKKPFYLTIILFKKDFNTKYNKKV